MGQEKRIFWGHRLEEHSRCLVRNYASQRGGSNILKMPSERNWEPQSLCPEKSFFKNGREIKIFSNELKLRIHFLQTCLHYKEMLKKSLGWKEWDTRQRLGSAHTHNEDFQKWSKYKRPCFPIPYCSKGCWISEAKPLAIGCDFMECVRVMHDHISRKWGWEYAYWAVTLHCLRGSCAKVVYSKQLQKCRGLNKRSVFWKAEWRGWG